MKREELLVERITYITKIALGEELNNMLGIEVNKDFNETILQASILAARVGMNFADEHPRWISVEDELPPITQWVLTYNPTYDEYHFDVERYGRGENLVDFGVTHWMPLPQAPTCSEKPNNCEKGGKK